MFGTKKTILWAHKCKITFHEVATYLPFNQPPHIPTSLTRYTAIVAVWSKVQSILSTT